MCSFERFRYADGTVDSRRGVDRRFLGNLAAAVRILADILRVFVEAGALSRRLMFVRRRDSCLYEFQNAAV